MMSTDGCEETIFVITSVVSLMACYHFDQAMEYTGGNQWFSL